MSRFEHTFSLGASADRDLAALGECLRWAFPVGDAVNYTDLLMAIDNGPPANVIPIRQIRSESRQRS